ncbi:hypothetical protein [Blastococcus saxobsidens]|uniref:Uncharacterized protein n=1 Tax=Blastococcus saxobsidens (strain DD2) TaxID=1146883 RepID=H6RW52_BLASD|nr:hypothetical protein [Blastococcus saxobsidens]CCG02069.1 protein of unknown function [Blastococcus saxobsidens DD2]
MVPLSDTAETVWTLFVYSWLVLCIPLAYGVRRLEGTRWRRPLAPLALYLVGFGPMMCAITVDAYVKEFRGAAMTWDTTEKTGRSRHECVHELAGAGQPYRVSPPVVLTEAELARYGGRFPVWADPMALADETEADRLRERRLYAGLAVAIAVVVLLYLVPTAVLAA